MPPLDSTAILDNFNVYTLLPVFILIPEAPPALATRVSLVL